MTEEIAFPPLLDLPPAQLEAQRHHLLSEISRSERLGVSLRRSTSARTGLPRLVLGGACVVAIALVIIGMGSLATRRRYRRALGPLALTPRSPSPGITSGSRPATNTPTAAGHRPARPAPIAAGSLRARSH
jgi:hypothetical protein